MIARKKNKRIGIALTSAAIVLALLFTGFGYPGFIIPLIRKKQPEPVVYTADELLYSIPDEEPEENVRVLPQGNSQAFSIEPEPGVVISAEENALDHDREFTLTPCTDEDYERFDAAIQQVDPDYKVLYAWDLDAGLAEDEVLPGTFHVDFDLEKLGILEENYPSLSAYRISDTGVWYEYAIIIENGHMSFDSNKNCPVTITGLLGATAAVLPFAALGWEFGGSGAWLWGFDKVFVYEKGPYMENSTTLGKKLYNLRIKYPDAVENAEKVRINEYTNAAKRHKDEIEKNAIEQTNALCGNNPQLQVYNVYKEQFMKSERERLVNDDPEYKKALQNLKSAVDKSGIKLSYIDTFSKYCIKANGYLKEQAKVKTPDTHELGLLDYFIYNQAIDIYLKYNYKEAGAIQFTTLGNYYVVIKANDIMEGTDRTGETFNTLIHELLHVSQREYRGKAKSITKFDEATANLIEFKARDYFDEITKVNMENPNRWQSYFIPIDATSTYIDGVSVTPMLWDKGKAEEFDAGDQGYPLCHIIDYLIKNYKTDMTFGKLFDAYAKGGNFTETLKTAFEMDDKALSAAYKKFIKANQTRFYGLAVEWYTNPNAGNQWALSRKGADQKDHAVITNQAYQTSVRRIYPQMPPEGRQKEVSILLAYDDNYKELTDFEMIPIGNKDYKNTKYGIMYAPKPYTKMDKVYTLEIDGGANKKSVTSGYTVWTLFAPKPIGEIELKDGMINFKLPEKSDPAKEGKIDGYRVTITCTTDGTKTEKFYKISGAGKEISLNASKYMDKDTKIENAQFKVSICEYIKEASGDKYFGPESDPTNSIVADMEETLEQMGAGHGLVNIGLGWKTGDDLDLHVTTPNGREIYYNNRNADGGTLDVDMQVSTIVASPAEHVDFPNPPAGTYTVSVVNFKDRTEGSDTPFVVVVEIAGKKKVYELTAGGEKSRTNVCTFTYGKPEGTEKGNEHLDD